MLLSAVKEIAERRITFGTSGNASERRAERPNTFWITPSGSPWHEIGVADLVTLSVEDGAVLSGTLKPSSEWRAHQALYKAHPWIGGIVHLHSQYVTVLSTLGLSVRPVHYQMARVGDEVPLVSYRTFGSQALADAVAKAIRQDCRAVLVENHGLFAVGASVGEALTAADEVEWTANVQYHAMLAGTPRILSPQELAEVRRAFQEYGQEPT